MRMTPFNPLTGNKCFNPESDQEKQAKTQMSQYQGFANDVNSGKYNVSTNNEPFNYNDISSSLDSIFGTAGDTINRDTSNDILTQQQGAAGSLASRGFTGGSILNDTQSGIASKLNQGKYNALGQLGIGKAQATMGLKDQFNQNQLNVDTNNQRNILGSLSGTYGQENQLLNNYDSTTWLNDLFAGLGLGAKAVGAAGTMGAFSGGSAAAALSDRRLKENIVKVGNKDGINIYEYNYKGYPKRYSGVMADEVLFAVKEFNGVQMVDYSLLPDIDFREV